MLRTGPSKPQPPPIRFLEENRGQMGNRMISSTFRQERHFRVSSAQNLLEADAMGSTASTRYDTLKPRREISVVESGTTAGQIKTTAGKRPREERRSMAPAAAGFILADSEGNPIYASQEAKTILAYPEGPRAFRAAWTSLQKAIFSQPDKQNPASGSTSRVETISGRRKYICLTISLDKPRGERMVGGSLAIVLERHREASYAFAKAKSEQFRLTEREREVVEFLIRGLTNKEIAARMQISPNTVRAFVRMVMGKLGISTRSGIVGMVFRDIQNLPSWDNEQNRFRRD